MVAVEQEVDTADLYSDGEVVSPRFEGRGQEVCAAAPATIARPRVK